MEGWVQATATTVKLLAKAEYTLCQETVEPVQPTTSSQDDPDAEDAEQDAQLALRDKDQEDTVRRRCQGWGF